MPLEPDVRNKFTRKSFALGIIPAVLPGAEMPMRQLNCECPDGYGWNASRTGCERQIPPQELCARDYPGSVPTGRDASGSVNCGCPDGYTWMSPVRETNPQELCSRKNAGSVPTGTDPKE